MTSVAPVFSNLNTLAPSSVENVAVYGSMESYNQSHGYILYRTTIPTGISGAQTVNIPQFGDRVEVFVNSVSCGVTYRPSPNTITIPSARVVAGATLDFFIEVRALWDMGVHVFTMTIYSC
jgi:hypothetical protein